MNKKKTISGVWCRSDNKFYYLETGKGPGPNDVTRLRSVLISRGLITFNRKDANSTSPSFLHMTLKEAKERGYEVEVIYVSEHVKKVMEARKQEESTNPWMK